MLRPKPTEITLTPADVEAACRRMRMRRAANPYTANVNPSPTLGLLPPLHGARMHRGPQRSRDSAVANLGEIPLLQPQEAIVSSSDDADQEEASFSPSIEHSSEEPLLASPAESTLASHTERPPSRPESQLAAIDDMTKSSDIPPQQFDYEKINSEDGHEGASQSRNHAFTDGVVEPAEAIHTPERTRAQPLYQHNSHVPSPLQQMYNISSPHQFQSVSLPAQTPRADGAHLNHYGESPTIHLHGYFDNRRGYTFRQNVPQTEPQSRTRPVSHSRTMTSSSDPSHSTQRHVDQSGSPSDDVFWTSPAPRPPSQASSEASPKTESSDSQYRSPLDPNNADHANAVGNAVRNTSQRLSSDVSESSQAYSFYELPDSRHSSRTYSQSDPSQYDGAAESRHVSRGAYHSIRLPDHHRVSSSTYLQPLSSHDSNRSTAEAPVVSQHGFSPIPTDPYTRGSSGQYATRPPIHLITPDNLLGEDQDATEAVARNLSSPLDVVEERATSYFQRLSAQIHANHAQRQAYSSAASLHPYRFRQSSGRGSVHDNQHGTSGTQNHSSTGDRYPQVRYSSTNDQQSRPQHHHHQQQPRDPQTVTQPTMTVNRRRVGAPSTRAGQRSSENVPVAPPISSTQETRPRFTTHRSPLFRPLHIDRRTSQAPSVPWRYSMPPIQPHPHIPRPRDMSNRPHVMRSPGRRPVVVSSGSEGPANIATATVEYSQAAGPTSAGVRVPRTLESVAPGRVDTDGANEVPGHIHYTHPHAQGRYQLQRQVPNEAQDAQVTTPTRPSQSYIRQERTSPSPQPPASLFNRPPSRGSPSLSTTLDVASGTTSRSPVSFSTRSLSMRTPPSVTRTMRRLHIPLPHRHRHEDQENGAITAADAEAMRQELGVVGGRHGVEMETPEEMGEMNQTPPPIGRFERRMG